MLAKSNRAPIPSSIKQPAISAATDLGQRLARPQRHRLLHGYPMAPLLVQTTGEGAPWTRLELDDSRPLIVGVLPHTFCNPSVRGCGFCTFPHEKHSNDAARTTTSEVAREVRAVSELFPSAAKRVVPALYFGGGTANLTPPDVFADLASALEGTFDLSNAEVSLEGAPIYFLTRNEALLDILCGMNVRHRRISLGVQTFDRDWIARMGRTAFGDAATIEAVVKNAHARGMTTSCDLLYNLPGQSKEAQIADVSKAIAIGFDQICIYNLVLDASIDSEWANDRSLLTRVAKPNDGCVRWLLLRDLLLLNGYRQTTLTNFERKSSTVHSGNRPFFAYERLSFDAARTDALGFGPGAISTFTDRHHQKAIKWMNTDRSADYVAKMRERGAACDRSFDYSPTDLRLLHITRALSALEIDRTRYTTFFGTDVMNDFGDAITACAAADLVTIDSSFITLTPRGMFYADAVAGLIAAKRARQLRHPNDAIYHAMG